MGSLPTFDQRAEQGSCDAHELEQVLDAIRPAMSADGGGVSVASVKNGVVSVRLQGTCLSCPSASMTLRFGLERTLKERLPWVSRVVRVT